MENYNLYFENGNSIYQSTQDIRETLAIISNRYMANIPPKSLTARAFNKDNFLQEFTGRYIFNFNEKFPDSDIGCYAYAFSYVFSKEETPVMLGFRAKAPAWVYLNGEIIFETASSDEVLYKPKTGGFTLKRGINLFFVKCRKTVLDFGCEFGSALLQCGALVFLNPIEPEKGMRGWAYSRPTQTDRFADVQQFPVIGDKLDEFWLPEIQTKHLSVREVLGEDKGYAYALTCLRNDSLKKNYSFWGYSSEECSIYVDGEKVFCKNGRIDFSKELINGLHIICAEIKDEGKKDFEFRLESDAVMSVSDIICDNCARWLYLGKLKNSDSSIAEKLNMLDVYKGENEICYWKTDLGDDVRLSSESGFFGRWTYPLGVVMYGLNETAKELSDGHIKKYVDAHMRRIADSYAYSLYDTEKYGRAALNYQLMMIDSLDFCGSCGNALLNVLDYSDKNVKKVADMIAGYMKERQERLPDGVFYRRAEGTYCENSIWADDLYMSVPFLCRYYKETGDICYLEDAVNQFKCFHQYLYMPDKKIMSHVYSLNYGKKNEIPWGRGNGWTVFALSELLETLPKEHSEYGFLVDFFVQLCEGILNYQDECGMWHQVIDEQSSYIESSCTAMFVCAFSRGIRNGWLKEPEFAEAAMRGWRALCRLCIDSDGNLYGVCRGSQLSFRREYYSNELGWVLNDQHGTGIVLLAGVNILRMQNLI